MSYLIISKIRLIINVFVLNLEISMLVYIRYFIAIILISVVSALCYSYFRSNHAKMNVVLIVVDSLPANQIGFYNSNLDNSPTIDKLAEGGAVFSKARSVSSWTKPSIASLLTSKPPSEHFVNGFKDKLSDNEDTLAEVFKGKGYKTAGFVSHTILSSDYGYSQGFDSYKQVSRTPDVHTAITSPLVVDHGIQWLNTVGNDKFFLLLHLFDPHFNYMDHSQYNYADTYDGPLKDPAEKSWSALVRRKNEKQLTKADVDYLINLQREEIAFTDYHISRILDSLKSLGKDKDTIVVVTADHGEEFMEHNSIGHTDTLFDEILHIPLIFYAPGTIQPLLHNTPVNLMDVFPTILELATGDKFRPVRGVSFAKAIQKGKELKLKRDLFAEAAMRSGERLYPNLVSVITQDGYKLIHNRGRSQWMLYNLNIDPDEQDNLIRVNVDKVRELKGKLEKLEALHDAGLKPANDSEPEPTLSSEFIKSLKSLGYL